MTPREVTTAADDAIDARAAEAAKSLPPMTPATAAMVAQHLAAAQESLARRDAAQRSGAA